MLRDSRELGMDPMSLAHGNGDLRDCVGNRGRGTWGRQYKTRHDKTGDGRSCQFDLMWGFYKRNVDSVTSIDKLATLFFLNPPIAKFDVVVSLHFLPVNTITMSESAEGIVPIPEPQGLPFLGNIGSIDPIFPLGSMLSLAQQFGKTWSITA